MPMIHIHIYIYIYMPGSTLTLEAALCGERAIGEPQAGKGRHALAPKAPE